MMSERPVLHKSVNLLIRLRFAGLVIAILTAIAVVGILVFTRVREPKWTPFMRGEQLAQKMGCFACHGGQYGLPLMPNLRSDIGVIPPFNANGPLMFYVQSDEEIRQWVLDGAPQRIKKLRGTLHDTALIRMPAYRGFVSDRDLNDLIAFVRGVALMQLNMPPRIKDAWRIAHDNGCFGCHGSMGMGGLSNPGSYKGYIPPWNSADYKELVRNRGELKEWILNGAIRRFEKNLAAKYFTSLQVIKMPAYKGVLKPAEVDAVIEFINWLRSNGKKKYPGDSKVAGTEGWRKTRVERGEFLYQSTGCASCHGIAGRSGIENPNASGGLVPSLNDLSERLGLTEKAQIQALVTLVEQGQDPAGYKGKEPFEDFATVQRLYGEMRELILFGGKPRAMNESLPPPPMDMPSWDQRLGADHGPHSREDVDSILAYLINLQSFDEE